MTNLYEAGDINQTGDPGGAADDVDDDVEDDIEDVDDGGDDGYEDDDGGDDDGVGEGNELGSVDGGTPLTVLTFLARSLSNDPDAVVIDTEERRNGLRLSLHVAPATWVG